MKRSFTATVRKEDDRYAAQALEVDVASQDKTADGALSNLWKALKLYFTFIR